MDKSRKVSIPDLLQKKAARRPLTMLTAYDFPGAKLVDESGVDIILVGDSLGMTVLGYPNTVSVTMADMLHHCKAVSRGASRAFLVGDMPFLSYQAEVSEAIRNAGRFIQEAGMDAVKLEGGAEMAATVQAIVNAGIPVMGHLGLTPQSATKLGGYKVQGKNAAAARKIWADAQALQDAGCFAVVLESIPAPVAESISSRLAIPTIGIGAGAGCDGQVLVFHDILGLFDQFTPKFVKRYAELRPLILDALKSYCREVESREFPGAQHAFKMEPGELKEFLEAGD